jgi:hypothetical protein
MLMAYCRINGEDCISINFTMGKSNAMWSREAERFVQSYHADHKKNHQQPVPSATMEA